MSDVDEEGLKGKAAPMAVGPSRHRKTRAARNRAQRSRRRRRIAGGFAVGLLVVIVVAAVFLGSKLWHMVFGRRERLRRRRQAATSSFRSRPVIRPPRSGRRCSSSGVVRTVRAFVDAAHGNTAITAIQPGFYRMRTEIPAANAVARLADPSSRVGRLVIPEGRQLDDTTDMKTNKTTPGILSLISRATCVDLDGNQRCVSLADLRTAAGKSTPTALAGAGLGP